VKRGQAVDDETLVKAKEMCERGMTQEAIAAELGVTQGTVSRMLRRGVRVRLPRGRRPRRRVQA